VNKKYKEILEKRIQYIIQVGNAEFFKSSYNLFGLGNTAIEPTPSQTLVSLEFKLKNVR
jgi:hypothetical protein